MVRDILSSASAAICLLHSPVGHLLLMCRVYFCQCPHERTSNSQQIDSIEFADNVHPVYIRAHTMLERHSESLTILIETNSQIKISVKNCMWFQRVGHTFCSSNAAARSAKQSDSESASRSTGSVSIIVFVLRSTVFV